jgi:hypothetical protein
MNTAELIYEEAKTLPEADAQEVLDFLEFLKAKRARHDGADHPNEAEQDKNVTLEQHLAIVEQMRAIRASQPMTYTTVEDMRREYRY